jgi:hypothetical protein
VRGRMNRIHFNGSHDIESGLLESERQTADASKQVYGNGAEIRALAHAFIFRFSW